MELAIPVVAFGWLYLISNQKQEPKAYKEPFAQRPVQQTAKYFKPKVATSASYFTDMAGRRVASDELRSENMTPFFGKQKAVGPELRAQSEQALDTMTGAGSLQITKRENAPLFNPEDNIQWASGAPNQSDFYQSRVNPSTRVHNVKPFQEQQVGPGLNQGYGTQGSGGFNSGMEAREKWGEKTVNELRVATKPKVSFMLDGHMGGPQTLVKNLGMEGKMEKHLPDKFFINTPDRYFTTVGAEVAPTHRPLQMNPEVQRVHAAYTGTAGNGGVESMPQPGLVRVDHRQQLNAPPLLPAGSSIAHNNNQGVADGYTAYDNNRGTSNAHLGNAQGLINAITAPILDILRPSRKADAIGPTRAGNPATTVPTSNLLPTNGILQTMKEVTDYSPYARGLRPHLTAADGYQTANLLPSETQRSTTSVPYVGASSMLPKPISYDADYNATISTNRAQEGRTAGGNTNMFLGHINQTTSNTKQHNAYMGTPTALYSATPTVQLNETRTPQTYANQNRNTPDILDAFKQNPYTQSLHSVA
jgi:hypothetical protein